MLIDSNSVAFALYSDRVVNYFTLQIELKRCKPSAKIASAYIDSNETLILKYSNQEEKDILANNWPEDAFNTGIELIIKTQKFYIALLNVDQEMDFDGEDIKSYLLENFKIINTMRIIKKSTKQPLNLIKGLITIGPIVNRSSRL